MIIFQYVGQIIKCWPPAEFPEHWIEYTNSICWISNTYYIPMTEQNILGELFRAVPGTAWLKRLVQSRILVDINPISFSAG